MGILEEIKSKKVLILGFGKEGTSTLKWLRSVLPEKHIGIADKLTLQEFPPQSLQIVSGAKNLSLHLGSNYLSELNNYEIVIKSPGIPISLIKPYLNSGQIITSQTKIFFELCQGRIIGVTGTKGKSTTCSLIFHILTSAQKKAHLIGNIGKPPLDVLLNVKPDHWAVQELSSHQLQNLTLSPHIAVLLAVTQDHLDYYGSFEEYAKAKANIALHQKLGDYLIFDQENEIAKNIASKSKAHKTALDISLARKIIPASAPVQLRTIYIKNCAAALHTAFILNIDERIVQQALSSFMTLEHRLEYVGEFQNIKFYNDSAAAAPSATIGAINALKGRIGCLILGGFERGVDFTPLAKSIWEADIPLLLIFPESGLRLWDTILKNRPPDKKLPKTFAVQKMQDAVSLAFQYTPKGKICLLSPASPSFGMFKDYQERGRIFKKLVVQRGKTGK